MHDTQKPFSESGTSPPRRVSLVRVHLIPGCTVGTGVGLDAEGALVLADALAAGEAVEVFLEGWQVLAWRRS